MEIWREQHVTDILCVLQDLFGDIDDNEVPELLDDSLDDEILGAMDWDEIIKDVSLLSLMDESDLLAFQSTELANEGMIFTGSFFHKLCLKLFLGSKHHFQKISSHTKMTFSQKKKC